MSVYRRFESETLASFITTNTNERRPIFASKSACELLLRMLYDVRRETGFLLLAFAVMPDHLHLILAPSENRTLGQVVQLIKGRFARAYNQNAGRSGSVWQSRYHERTMRSEIALSRAIEYVDHNAVPARLVSEPQDYPWSSASGRFLTDLEQYLSG